MGCKIIFRVSVLKMFVLNRNDFDVGLDKRILIFLVTMMLSFNLMIHTLDDNTQNERKVELLQEAVRYSAIIYLIYVNAVFLDWMVQKVRAISA